VAFPFIKGRLVIGVAFLLAVAGVNLAVVITTGWIGGDLDWPSATTRVAIAKSAPGIHRAPSRTTRGAITLDPNYAAAYRARANQEGEEWLRVISPSRL
ncbi:MAG TPA: hypothetical protein VLZ81_05730, partial [Blastocatellia bacterium]|nr:hypothetical protein [Blastocatellia bacterium]